MCRLSWGRDRPLERTMTTRGDVSAHELSHYVGESFNPRDRFLLVPTAKEIPRAGDIMALAGTHDAVDRAQLLLLGESEEV